MSERSETDARARAVRLEAAGKVYRLYQKPAYRFLDLLGLCPAGAAYYTEHHALVNVDLDVDRGEKVAIIGRNGAGKSTLLKLITGIVRPTSGTIHVSGRISNLLQIGSGFHPDFTGRQNVFASLAHQGIVGRAASALFDEIVDFSEISDYIDQPMKTYSTGMCSRLMFSASIVLEPELLIVDEILGVGDAYFSHKSFERMRELCSRQGTTLLLVTHDVYSAQNLCERFIWIDRGRVTYDGDGKTAVAMYETSVKEQEESARRRRAVADAAESASPSMESLHVAVRSRTGFALERPLALAAIELVDATGRVERLDMGAESEASWHLVPEGNLGPTERIDGRWCRVLRTYGSIYHKAEWIVMVPAGSRIARARVYWFYDGADEAEFLVYGSGRELLIRGGLSGGDGWQAADIAAAGASQPGEPVQMEFGSALVRITRTQLLDAHGFEVGAVRHGDPLVVRVDLAVNETRVREVSFVLAFTRPGTSYAVNVVDHQLRLSESEHSVVDVTLPAVRLGSGAWFLRVGVAEAGIFKRGSIGYFALDERWYHLMRDGLPFDVTSLDHLDSAGCFMVHDGRFSVRAGERAREAAAVPARGAGRPQ